MTLSETDFLSLAAGDRICYTAGDRAWYGDVVSVVMNHVNIHWTHHKQGSSMGYFYRDILSLAPRKSDSYNNVFLVDLGVL